jgi:hypothetical protein
MRRNSLELHMCHFPLAHCVQSRRLTGMGPTLSSHRTPLRRSTLCMRPNAETFHTPGIGRRHRPTALQNIDKIHEMTTQSRIRASRPYSRIRPLTYTVGLLPVHEMYSKCLFFVSARYGMADRYGLILVNHTKTVHPTATLTVRIAALKRALSCERGCFRS